MGEGAAGSRMQQVTKGGKKKFVARDGWLQGVRFLA
jgi:hypothetical protein